ncbi:MAG: lipid-A-disaccharide synthase [Tannerella sp.]|jgi:lipid-A-disaccharide synthase|nr:lipid-A-disaccharide synthase [Tannerella sp.]
MKYYLIAGEASGDLHASNLMKALKREDLQADFRFFGGDLMQAAGGSLVRHYREMAYMGIIPVLLHLRTILRNMRMCREDIRTCNPDVVILIDYPGFNLKIAKFVKTQLNIPVHYYISPKIWAWKKYRIKSFRRYVDRMFCILPFETDFFKSLDYPVDYAGNPSVDSVSTFRASRKNKPDTFRTDNGLSDKPLIAVLAGSRKAEIRQNLPTMLSVAAQFPEFQPVIAGAPGLTPEDYKQATGDNPGTETIYGQTYDLLEHATVALVTSGTATLETALFRVPQVVCYYVVGGRLVNFIFERFFHVPYISLVNLIAGKEVVRELFGAKFSHQKIHEELKRILEDYTYKTKMLEGYDRVISLLGAPGASERTARLIVAYLSGKSS